MKFFEVRSIQGMVWVVNLAQIVALRHTGSTCWQLEMSTGNLIDISTSDGAFQNKKLIDEVMDCVSRSDRPVFG